MSKNNDKTNVMRILDQKKIPYTSHNYLNTGAVSGTEVAEALGEDPDMVFKTLVTVGKSKTNYVFVVPVNKELNLKKAAQSVGEKSIEMIRSKELLPDKSAQKQERIIFSGGKIGYQVELTLKDLEKVIRFQVEDVAE